jgi:phosphatidylinositol alpha-1,6-mannosyltransferase
VRILALVTDAFGGYGGIAQYNRDLITAFAQSERVSEIVVLPRIASGAVYTLPAQVRQLEPRGSRSAYAAQAMWVAQQKEPFDIIFNGHLFHAPLAAVIGHVLRIPVWLQTHGIDAWETPKRVVGAAAERSALITTVSRHTKRKLLAWANVDPEHVRVLPNTVRSIFTPGDKNEAFLEQLDLVGRPIILTVSRLAKADYYKGHRRLVRILPKVLQHFPTATYVIVGDGDARSELEEEVSRGGIASSVRFLGRLSDEQVLHLYRSAAVFAMPSTKEGFGIVFIEAAAAGLPVIGGNRDGSADALADGVIGMMVNPDDDEALTNALLVSLSGSVKADPVHAQRFSFENFARHVDDLVRRLAR